MRKDYQVPMVLKALSMLETFARVGGDFSLTGIAQQCKIPKASAFRILETLQLAGYVEKEPSTGQYRIGMKVLELGRSVRRNDELRTLGVPFLLALQQRFNESTNLAVLDSGSVLYLATIESSASLRIARGSDMWAPIHCTALGKALAAFSPWESIRAVLELKGMPRRTHHTITQTSEFKRELEKIRAKGVAYDNEEFEIGGWCVASPIFDYAGTAVCALSVSVPLTRVSGRERDIEAAVKGTAAQFSAKLDYDPTGRQTTFSRARSKW